MRYVVGALMLMALTLASCQSAKEKPGGRLRISVSIPPLVNFVERVGGPYVEVKALVAPGQNPHTFEPTPKQVTGVSAAEVYFSIRWPFEMQMLDKIRRMNPKLKVIDVAQGITFRQLTQEEAAADNDEPAKHNATGEPDPHIWLSPANAKIIAANICAALKGEDPAHAAEFDKNLAVLQADLDRVSAKIAAALAPFKGKGFIVFHPAFGYFGDAYGLKQIPVEIEGKEPSARQLADFVAKARRLGVKVVFVQPQFSSKSAEAIAQSIGGAVAPMDDLPRDYLKNLEDMAEKVEKALAPAPE